MSQTTGSAVVGLVDGMGLGLGAQVGVIELLDGNPDTWVTAPGSTIGFDKTNSEIYMNTIGSTWIHLGSVE